VESIIVVVEGASPLIVGVRGWRVKDALDVLAIDRTPAAVVSFL
jgi:hypothetical protein